MMNWAKSSFRKKKKDDAIPPEEEVNIRPNVNESKGKKKSISSILSPSCTKGNTLDREPYKRSTASVAGETDSQESLVTKKKSRNLLKRMTSKRHSKQSLSSLSIAEEEQQKDVGARGDSLGKEKTPSEKMRQLSSAEEGNEVSITLQKQQNKVDVEVDSVDVVEEEHNDSESVTSGNSNAPKCMEVSNKETRPVETPALSGPHTEGETKASLDKVTPADCLAVSLDQTTATATANKLSESDTKNADLPQNTSTKLLSSHANNSGQIFEVRAPPRSSKNRNNSSSSAEEQQPGIGSDNSSSRQAGKVSIEVNSSEEGKEQRHRPSLGASGTAPVDQSQTLTSSVCGGTASGEAGDLGTAGTSQDRASKPSSTSPSATTCIDETQVEQEVVLERAPLSKASEKNDQNLLVTDDVKNRGSISSGKRNFGAPVGVTTPKTTTERNSNQVGKYSPLASATGNSNPGVVSGTGDSSPVGPSNKELECLGALLDSIIVDGEESGGAHRNTPVVVRSSGHHGGKVTYEVGGASGKEVSVSISEDFNKSATERVEVVEEPLTKKYFAPLTVNEEKKSLKATPDAKDINPVIVPNSGVSVDKVINDAIVTRPVVTAKDDKKLKSDSLLDDIIVNDKGINSGVVVENKSAYGGKVTYEIGGESAKVVTVNIRDDFNKRRNSAEVVEEPIAKKFFAPLGDEEEKSATGDAKLSTKNARTNSPEEINLVPSNKVPAKESSSAVGLHKKELQITEASDDLGHLLAELETAIEDLEHLKAVPVVDYSNGVAVEEKPFTKKHFTPLTPEDDLRRGEDATSNDDRGSIEDVTRLQRLSTHEISSTDAKYTSPETFYTPMNVFKVLGSLKSVSTTDKSIPQTLASAQTTNTPSTTADHRTSTKSAVGDKSLNGNQVERVASSDNSLSEHSTPSSNAAGGSASGADEGAGDEELETMDLVQGRAGLRHHQHVKDRFVHFSSPGAAVLRSQRSHPPITEEPSSGSPIRHGPASVASSLTKIESAISSSSTTNATTGPSSGDKSAMGAASAKKITESAAVGDVPRATLAKEEEFDDIDDTVGDMHKCGESKSPEEEDSKIIENKKQESRSCQAKADVVSVAADDKVLLDKSNKKEVTANFHLKREVSESSSKEKESKSPVAKYGFGVLRHDSRHSRHGSDKRKSKSPERKDDTSSNHHGKDATPFKTDENCNENRPTVIMPKLKLEHVDDKEGASKENGSPIGGRPSPVSPVLITVTAATPVKIQKQFSGYEVKSMSSDAGEEAASSDRACASLAEVDDVMNSEVAKSPPEGQASTNGGKKDEGNPFGDEDDDEVISIELQRESSVKLQNRINVTLSKSEKNEVSNQVKSPQPLKSEQQEKPEHVVNIRKEIEKLNKRMEENNTSRKSLPSSDRNSATKFDLFKPIAKSSPESKRGKVLHGVTPPVSPTDDRSRIEDLVNGNVVPSRMSPSKKGAGATDTLTKTEQAAMIVNATSPEKVSSSARTKAEPPVEAISHISTLELSSNTSPDEEGPIGDEITNRSIATVDVSSDPKLPEPRSPLIVVVEVGGPITNHEESEPTDRRAPPSLQVQPSTESYLTPCKELIESSSQKIVSIPVIPTCGKKNQSLNPFEDSDEDVYEESDEDPITVIHSTPPKLVPASKPIPAPKPTPAPKLPTVDTTNPFGGDDEEDDAEIIASLNGTSNPDVSRPPVPSPLPRTSLRGSLSTTPVPSPRTTKPGSLSGSCRSVNNSPDCQKQNHYQNTGGVDDTNGDGSFGGLRSALNVSTMSTKSLNPFDESEEDDEANNSRERIGYGLGSKKKIGGSQYSLRGDFSTMGDFTRNPHRGSLPIRRNKRRAPLPPGMQAPAPSPAHSAITPTASLPPPGAKGVADGLMAHNPSARRATWGNSSTPRKTPPPRPPPPSPVAGKILQQNS